MKGYRTQMGRYSVLWGQWGWVVREGILEVMTFELNCDKGVRFKSRLIPILE